MELATAASQDLLLTTSDLSVHGKFQLALARLIGGPLLQGASRLQIRAAIEAVSAKLKSGLDSGEIANSGAGYALTHTFAPHSYSRQVTIPAGEFVLGRIHKHAHHNVLLSGTLSVLTEEGGFELLTGPCVMVSPAGVRRLLLTHTQCDWTVFHITELTDLDGIEDAVIAKSYTELGWEEPGQFKIE
jgi:hypothetical protein